MINKPINQDQRIILDHLHHEALAQESAAKPIQSHTADQVAQAQVAQARRLASANHNAGTFHSSAPRFTGSQGRAGSRCCGRGKLMLLLFSLWVVLVVFAIIHLPWNWRTRQQCLQGLVGTIGYPRVSSICPFRLGGLSSKIWASANCWFKPLKVLSNFLQKIFPAHMFIFKRPYPGVPRAIVLMAFNPINYCLTNGVDLPKKINQCFIGAGFPGRKYVQQKPFKKTHVFYK